MVYAIRMQEQILFISRTSRALLSASLGGQKTKEDELTHGIIESGGDSLGNRLGKKEKWKVKSRLELHPKTYF